MASRKLKGSLAIITGSGQGLGRAFATQLLNSGARVCLSDVSTEMGEQSLRELGEKFGRQNVHFISCDVRSVDQLEGLYMGCEDHFNDKVNIFCNNAGVNHAPGWRTCLEIDTLGVVAGTEVAMSRMGREGGGQGGVILNTASLAGVVSGWNRESSSYFVAKHGVVALTRSLGKEPLRAVTGVEHMAICPAFADTAILNDVGLSRKTLERKEGIMTPEYVSECFLKLLETGRNGDVMIVRKNTPPFIYSDLSLPLVTLVSAMAKLSSRVLGGRILRPSHQAVLLLMASVSIILFSHLILTFIV